jgi:vacuolar-type H+-ATPase subunit E/Vma4
MGLEKVIGRVEADGAAEAARLLADAEGEVARLMAEARVKRERTLAEYSAKAVEDVRMLRSREAARTEVEVKKAALASNKAVLDEARAAVLESLRRMPAQERARHHASLLGRLGPEFAGGTIHCRKGDEAHFSAAKGMAVKGDLDAAGGFVAESRDGKLAADARFETLLESAWERRIAETSAALFGKV